MAGRRSPRRSRPLRRVADPALLLHAAKTRGMHEVLEVGERLREREATQRRRKRVGEERPRDLVAGARLVVDSGQRAGEAVVVMLGDLARSPGRVEDALAVPG